MESLSHAAFFADYLAFVVLCGFVDTLGMCRSANTFPGRNGGDGLMMRAAWFLLQLALTLFLAFVFFIIADDLMRGDETALRQSVRWLFLLLPISGIPVIWRGAATAEKPFGIAMRVLRFVAYGVFSLMALIMLMLVWDRGLKFLWMMVPFVLPLVILVKTRPVAAPDISDNSAPNAEAVQNTPHFVVTEAADVVAPTVARSAPEVISAALFWDEQLSVFVSVLLALLLGGVIYAWKYVGYIGSTPWFFIAAGLSFAAAGAVVFAGFEKLAKRPDVQALRLGHILLRRRDLVAAGFMFFIVAWPSFYSFGAVATGIMGQPHRAIYAYAQKTTPGCVEIGTQSFFSQTCLSPVFLRHMAKEGKASFSGKKSWFGVTLSEIAPVF